MNELNKTFIDTENGTLERRIFTDQDVFQKELETVFTKAWLFVGHESQVPKPGDFFTSRMGKESVILVRDKANQIHVFLNSCRHRGMSQGIQRYLHAHIIVGHSLRMVNCVVCQCRTKFTTMTASKKKIGH